MLKAVHAIDILFAACRLPAHGCSHRSMLACGVELSCVRYLADTLTGGCVAARGLCQRCWKRRHGILCIADWCQLKIGSNAATATPAECGEHAHVRPPLRASVSCRPRASPGRPGNRSARPEALACTWNAARLKRLKIGSSNLGETHAPPPRLRTTCARKASRGGRRG